MADPYDWNAYNRAFYRTTGRWLDEPEDISPPERDAPEQIAAPEKDFFQGYLDEPPRPMLQSEAAEYWKATRGRGNAPAPSLDERFAAAHLRANPPPTARDQAFAQLREALAEPPEPPPPVYLTTADHANAKKWKTALSWIDSHTMGSMNPSGVLEPEEAVAARQQLIGAIQEYEQKVKVHEQQQFALAKQKVKQQATLGISSMVARNQGYVQEFDGTAAALKLKNDYLAGKIDNAQFHDQHEKMKQEYMAQNRLPSVPDPDVPGRRIPVQIVDDGKGNLEIARVEIPPAPQGESRDEKYVRWADQVREGLDAGLAPLEARARAFAVTGQKNTDDDVLPVFSSGYQSPGPKDARQTSSAPFEGKIIKGNREENYSLVRDATGKVIGRNVWVPAHAEPQHAGMSEGQAAERGGIPGVAGRAPTPAEYRSTGGKYPQIFQSKAAAPGVPSQPPSTYQKSEQIGSVPQYRMVDVPEQRYFERYDAGGNVIDKQEGQLGPDGKPIGAAATEKSPHQAWLDKRKVEGGTAYVDDKGVVHPLKGDKGEPIDHVKIMQQAKAHVLAMNPNMEEKDKGFNAALSDVYKDFLSAEMKLREKPQGVAAPTQPPQTLTTPPPSGQGATQGPPRDVQPPAAPLRPFDPTSLKGAADIQKEWVKQLSAVRSDIASRSDLSAKEQADGILAVAVMTELIGLRGSVRNLSPEEKEEYDRWKARLAAIKKAKDTGLGSDAGGGLGARGSLIPGG